MDVVVLPVIILNGTRLSAPLGCRWWSRPSRWWQRIESSRSESMLSACLTARSDKRGTPAQSISSTTQARHLHCGRHVGKKACNPRSHALITTFPKQSTATVQREADNIIPSAAGSVRLLEWLARFPRIPPQVLSARGSAHTPGSTHYIHYHHDLAASSAAGTPLRTTRSWMYVVI